ncbi:MAG: hypothetical protein R3B45_02260 [Bdellovibrionota bacterium]
MKLIYCYILLCFGLLACGSRSDKNYIKNYVLAVENGDAKTRLKFEALISEFNEYAGIEALHYSQSMDDANSIINLVKDLRYRSDDGHKIGWGQWMTTTTEKRSYSGFKRNDLKTIEYSMHIELDQDYVESRILSAKNSAAHYDLQKLFFHEVGHGLQMPHNPDKNHMMYEEISGYKDFAGFFEEVMHFFD